MGDRETKRRRERDEDERETEQTDAQTMQAFIYPLLKTQQPGTSKALRTAIEERGRERETGRHTDRQADIQT